MDPNEIIKNIRTLAGLKDRLRQYEIIGRRYDRKLADRRLRELFILEEKPADEVEELFWNQVYDYEQVLSEAHGCPMQASYTRRAVKKSSVREFLTGLMTRPKTYGWKVLEETNRPEASYEVVLEEYPDKFPEDAVKVALERLAKARKS